MTEIYHPNEDYVFLCPTCEHRQDLYQRQDGSIKCYHCGETVPNKRQLAFRKSHRGVET